MKGINTREKNLGVFTVVVCSLLIISGVNRRVTKTLKSLQEELELNQEKIGKAKSMYDSIVAERQANMEKGKAKDKEKVAASTTDRKLSINLMKDLTSSGQLNNIKVLSAENTGNNVYKVVVEAEFTEMMRFFTYLERKDGKFSIGSASLSRVSSDKGSVPNRGLQATFQIGAKS